MKKVLWFQNNILILRCRKLIINLTKGDTTMTTKEKELGNLIEKCIDFDKIVHSFPNILRDPVYIRLEVIRTLKNNGLVVYDNPYGSFRKSVC